VGEHWCEERSHPSPRLSLREASLDICPERWGMDCYQSGPCRRETQLVSVGALEMPLRKTRRDKETS